TNVSGTQTATDRRSARESHQPAAEKRPDFLRSGELGLAMTQAAIRGSAVPDASASDVGPAPKRQAVEARRRWTRLPGS
ncbi:MAG: hypothetical protein ACYTKD_28830, partial [Planctomycetota bacterium]